ncbi:MAG: hypothetical protein ONB30_07795 [candidate division KSB1 bacterium]|nr:hypothetical protein [candidate division KSB1 bacterium]MDZ7295315.1 hypothetical protein [candidate division KSB1 bacterium]MDZ7338426.1 hypothetical protein [candidate division KSB1 bacterium]MDZ7393228.1 hypothetical protein [candidate division KSB1 bacterium]MDZ7414428.1 hypothetical protein [candidate division KSB1 bacterium]
MHKDRDVSLVIGCLMIVLGALLLASKLELFQLSGGTVWTIMLGVSAVALAIVYAREHRRWWALLLACWLGLMAVERLLPWTGYEQWRVMWELSLLGAGLAFVVVFLRHPAQWWWLLPGGILLTIGLTGVVGRLDLVPGHYQAVIFFAGLSITFGLLYILRNEQRKLAWAQYPALSLLGVAVLVLILGTPEVHGLVLPLVLLGVGLLVLLRSLKGAQSATRAPKGRKKA